MKQEIPEWARNAVNVCLQELQIDGHNLRTIHVDELSDHVYQCKPKLMSFDQYEREIEPLVRQEGRKHGLKG